jgi:hypothetical protein
MKLPDRSPGLTLVIAAALLCGTVLAEIGMLMAGSSILMFATLALAIVIAAFVCRWLFTVLADEDGVAPQAAVAAPATAAAPAPAPARRRAPRATALPV